MSGPLYRATCRLCSAELDRDTGFALEPGDCPACGPSADAGEASHRERLAPVLEQLGKSAFLDLCELLLMFSEKMPHGMLKWDHPRVLVHIRHPKKVRP